MFVSREIQEIGTAVVKGVSVAVMTDLLGGSFCDESVHSERMANTVFHEGGTSVPAAVIFCSMPCKVRNIREINLIDERDHIVTKGNFAGHKIT